MGCMYTEMERIEIQIVMRLSLQKLGLKLIQTFIQTHNPLLLASILWD